LPFCAVFRYKREKFSAAFVLCRKMMRPPVCRDENSHRFCAENVIYLLYHNTAKITIKTPRLDDGCRPNRPPPPDFFLFVNRQFRARREVVPKIAVSVLKMGPYPIKQPVFNRKIGAEVGKFCMFTGDF